MEDVQHFRPASKPPVHGGIDEFTVTQRHRTLAYGLVEITEGNIRNNHIYLAKVMDLFPADVCGGANKAAAASRRVQVHWGSEKVETDIDNTKRIFRRRGWVGRFFKENRIVVGDRVLLERMDTYVFRISKYGGASALLQASLSVGPFRLSEL